MHSDESSDEGSPATQIESDMDSNIRADVEVVTTTAATAIVDGLGSEPVLAGVEAGFEPGLTVVESKSEPEEAEADVEIHLEEIEVDVATRIDISDDLLMLDVIERLGQLEEGMQGYVDEELRQVRKLRAHGGQRLWRMETFMMRTQDYRP
ncbi:hypothetical protein Tco_0065223 [Tanacetum coccineum]